MKTTVQIFAIIAFVLFFTATGESQISNFRVNGDTTAFTVASGEVITWEYDIDSGGTAYGGIWLDLNENGQIDTLSDKSLFGTFTQRDGDPEGDNGPPDMDGQVNGHIYLSMPLGLAPAHYILSFTEYSVTKTIPGVVTPLLSPAFTLSGLVTPPAGMSKKDITIQAEQNNGGTFWMALTDTSGNYMIKFDSSAISQTWRLRVVDEFPPAICSPAETLITTDTSITGLNFTFLSPTSKIYGYLKNEGGNGIPNARMRANPQNNNGGGNIDKEATTDLNGFYQIGFTNSELLNDSMWNIETNTDGLVPNYFPPRKNNIILHPNDSVRVDLTAWTADDSITGRVTVDGNSPGGMTFYIYAGSQDSGNTECASNPTTGEFTLYVTKKITNYYIGISDHNIPAGYGYEQNVNQVHAGDANLILRVSKLAWFRQQSNVQNVLTSLQFINDSTGWVVGPGVILSTVDSGKTWSTQQNSPRNFNAVFFVNPSTGWVLADSVVLKTTTGGSSWTPQNVPTNTTLFDLYFSSVTDGWISGSNSTLLHTTDGGDHWQSVNTGIGGDYRKILFTNSLEGWIAGFALLHTTDGGGQWNQVSVPGVCYVPDMQFVDVNHGWLLSVGCGNSVFATTDGGQTWDSHTIDSMNWISSFSFLDTLNGWAVGQAGKMYSTINGGVNWYPRPSGAFNSLNDIQFVNSSLGWAVGYDGMILRTTLGGAVTGIRDENPGTIPDKFSLHQNYPNPFNPTTTFSFTISQSSFVTLKVYNILGQEVASLLNEERHAGTYAVTWNPDNQPSGIYFYRMTAGKFVETKKMVLMR